LRVLTRGALGAASLTALLALPFGLLALDEPNVLRAAGAFGLDARTVNGPTGQALMVAICVILFGLQFWATREVGFLAFGLQQRNGQTTGGSQ
jgi:hypothetical protein